MKALAVEGWKLAEPEREEAPWRRILRVRKCNPPRLTTKIVNPPIQKGK